MDLTPGTVLLGKYRVDHQLGIGGMARVVRATHLFLQQPVAIKVLLPEMVANESTVQRFLREAQATVRLRSEHVARVQDVGTFDDGTPFMVMEYLDGNDLNQILRHHGPQSPAVVVDLLLQACEGISEAHANSIIHRDIKPSNFFLTQRPDGSMLLKILDFGISKAPVGYDDLTGTQTVIGTPTYMAPEQMRSGKAADPRSDIWSLGVVMYQLLTGRPPFQGESYAELILQVDGEAPSPMQIALPLGLAEIIYRCLEKAPAARFQDAGELARSLAPFASDPTVGMQAAVRATRILGAARNSQLGIPIGNDRYATPSPYTPPPDSSLSVGRGQATAMVKSSKGWLVAGVLSLVILAGAGGWFASRMTGTSAATT
ncbi:MAG: serine/threonine-protein kinase, partial [Proteobacteria bacterium]|nr:serine/threonine-protein kinase [Pseudomonadota bacterium]